MKNLLMLSLAAYATFAACGPSKPELKNIGSDTMLEAAGAWAEAYREVHPEVAISVSGQGSGVGIKSMIDGECDIANSSRTMTNSEIALAKTHGVTPVQHEVGHDGIAIFVHKDNPVASITMEQLKEVFGIGGKLTRWSELGVKLADPGADTIAPASRQNSSGTFKYFREVVLGGDKASFKAECNLLNSSKDVVDFCAKTKSAVGYSGLASATKEVRVVPVIDKTGKPVMPTVNSVLDGSYLISRPLLMYTKGEPEGQIKQYLEWIKSDAGQNVLVVKGYVPLRKMQ